MPTAPPRPDGGPTPLRSTFAADAAGLRLGRPSGGPDRTEDR